MFAHAAHAYDDYHMISTCYEIIVMKNILVPL